MMNRFVFSCTAAGASFLLLCSSASAVDIRHQPLIPNLPAVPGLSISTVPAISDMNPYGVAFVPPGFPKGGPLSPGDILVSNFNNSGSTQGTGRTIVRITPGGEQSLFFQGPIEPPPGLGLTTALAVLRQGFVLVGNLPSPTGMCMDPGHVGVDQGSLLVLDRFGSQVASFTDPNLLDGPWDMTTLDEGNDVQIYVSSVLNGVVSRFDLTMPNPDHGGPPILHGGTQIASGYAHHCDPMALVVGPTGLAFNFNHSVLYVASTGDNAIYAIDRPADPGVRSGPGRLVYQDDHLRGPLGLALAPNDDLIAAHGDIGSNADPMQPSELVEFTQSGQFVGQRSVNSMQGAAFGIALSFINNTVRFAAVDDVAVVLDIWTIPAQ